MKRKTKGLLALAGTALISGFLFWRNCKKIRHEEKVLEETRKEDLKAEVHLEGIAAEEYLDDEDKNKPSSYLAFRLALDGDLRLVDGEVLDLDSAEKAENVIHVIGNSVILRIPDYVKSRGKQSAPVYMGEIKEIIGDLENELNLSIKKKIVCYVKVEWEKNGKKTRDTFELPVSVYQNFATEKYDGLVEFYEDVMKNQDINPESFDALQSIMAANGFTPFTVIGIFLGIKLTANEKIPFMPIELAKVVKKLINTPIEFKGSEEAQFDYVVYHGKVGEVDDMMSAYFFEDHKIHEGDFEPC